MSNNYCTCVHLCSVFISGTCKQHQTTIFFPNSFRIKKGRLHKNNQQYGRRVPNNQSRSTTRSRLVVRRWQLTRAHKACAFPNLPSPTHGGFCYAKVKVRFLKKNHKKVPIFWGREITPKKNKKDLQKKSPLDIYMVKITESTGFRLKVKQNPIEH